MKDVTDGRRKSGWINNGGMNVKEKFIDSIGLQFIIAHILCRID